MLTSRRRSRLVLLSLMVSGALLLASPAIAQTIGLGTVTTNANGAFSTTVTIPAGTPPGTYILSAVGQGPLVSPYPPTSTGGLTVSSNVVVAGGTLQVSGGGFLANTPVVLSMTFQGQAAAFSIAQTSTTRTLTAVITVVAPGGGQVGGNITINNNVSCTSNATATADSGQYRIAQAGQTIINNNNSVDCRAEATAIAQQIEKTPVHKPVGKTLVRTGVDALPLLAAGLATILLGSVLLNAGRRRDRFQGSVGSA